MLGLYVPQNGATGFRRGRSSSLRVDDMRSPRVMMADCTTPNYTSLDHGYITRSTMLGVEPG